MPLKELYRLAVIQVRDTPYQEYKQVVFDAFCNIFQAKDKRWNKAKEQRFFEECYY